MAYTTKEKIENYIMSDIDISFDTQVSKWISAVERFINKYTGKPEGFEADVAFSTKYYDGSGKREIFIDDFTEIESVEILALDSTDVEYTLTEGENSDYITYPYNTTPKNKLLLTLNSEVGAFYSGNKRIKISAKWGDAASLYEDIELAATILVGEIVKEGRDGGQILSESLGDYSAQFEIMDGLLMRMSNVKRLLDNYRILEID